jgi:hypothetical protein
MLATATAKRFVRRVKPRILQITADDILGHAGFFAAPIVDVHLRHIIEVAVFALVFRQRDVVGLLAIAPKFHVPLFVIGEVTFVDVVMTERAPNPCHLDLRVWQAD